MNDRGQTTVEEIDSLFTQYYLDNLNRFRIMYGGIERVGERLVPYFGIIPDRLRDRMLDEIAKGCPFQW